MPISLSTDKRGTPITVGGSPDAIAFTSHSGKLTAWVADASGGRLDEVNLGTGVIETTVSVGDDPVAEAITPDGSTAYVVDAGSDEVTPVALSSPPTAGTPISVGNDPSAIAISDDGTMAVVVDAGDGAVTPITLLGGTPGAEVRVPGASAVAYGKSDLEPYVVSSTSGKLFQLQTGSKTPREIAGTGSDPVALAVEPLAPIAIVLDEAISKLTEIDISTGKSFWSTSVGSGPVALAVRVSTT